MTGSAATTALQVADWRRQVFGLYQEVRRLAGHDPSAAHEVWRSGRDDLFAQHPASPLLPRAKGTFAGLPVAPYDPDWRLELVIQPAATATMAVDTGTDGEVPFERIGRVELPGGPTLDVWRLQGYGGGIFLPVRDATAGRPGGSYGGGRYLLDTIKGADLGPGREPDSLVVDLNFCYNPSCAYDPAWACPLAPLGNTVDVPIPAGELYAAPPD